MNEASERKQRVLVVDDNKDIVRVVQRILSGKGYELSAAYDGERALEMARELLPDLILLDVMMPRVDGLEVCRKLKADEKTAGIMIILVTGRGSLEHLVQGFEAGADDYIPKPFHMPELLARTRSALHIKALTDDLEARNRQLVQSQSQLVQKEKMATIGLLASGIAHEFNNIMAGLSGYAQLAQRDPQYKTKLVDVALTQTQRAFELTKSLSTYNRAGSSSSRCEVREIIESALCLITKEAQRVGVTITTELEEGLVASISPGHLQEILLNLLINGLDAIRGQPGEIVVRTSAVGDDRALLEVTDSGAGMDAETQRRIFDPFFTTKGALGGGSQSGTGLGLTVCYNIVQSNRGEIDVVSTPGEGTTFRVTLPRSSLAPPRSFQDELPTLEPFAEGRPLRVLVVDDEQLAQETISDYLKGHDVVCCEKVDEALDLHREKPFEFVILDICLKGPRNGFQAFDEFSRTDPAPQLIFASGFFPDNKYQKYLARAHGHLLKPFLLEDLGALLGLPPAMPVAEAGQLAMPSG